MAVTLSGAVGWRNTGTAAATVAKPAGIVSGDLLMVLVQIGGSNRDITDWSAKGWWLHTDTIINSREIFIFSRIYRASDDSSAYTFTLDGSAQVAGVSASLTGHNVTTDSDIRMGTVWTRGANGGAQNLTVAPGMTSTINDSYALAFFAAASTTATTMTPSGSFSLLAERAMDPSPEWPGVFGLAMPTAGATGDQQWTANASSPTLNGLGVQFLISPGVIGETYVSDSFSRTVAAGNWGTPDTGPTWTISGTTGDVSVDGAKGVFSDAGGHTTYARNPITPKTDLTIEYEMQIDKINLGGNAAMRTIVRYIDTSNDYHFRTTIANGGAITLGFYRADVAAIGSTYAFGTLVPNTVYKIKVAISGINPTVLKGKMWDASGSEPAWQITTSDSTAGYQIAGTTALRHSSNVAVTNGPLKYSIDNYLVTNGVEPVTDGAIGAHGSFSPAADSITVGFDKQGGSVIQVALCDSSGIELTRQTASNDATTGWGNVVFTSLTAATTYKVRFYADSIMQTDAQLTVKTLPSTAPVSYVAITGSCQFTASNHPVWDVIATDAPIFLAHMGDMQYDDATTEPSWRSAMEASMSASKFKALLEKVPIHWSMDNHDRIITDKGGSGAAKNYGTTDPLTATEWKYLAGSTGWATSDTLGRTWVAGRVRYIQADMWSVRQDPDFDTGTLTFLGAAQKQWWKDTLAAATEPLIVWFCNWTSTNYTNGRWNSFPDETTELENWLNARPDIKRRMVMIGGDSHSLQADSGTRTGTQYRFKGIPSLNMSGFNRSGTAGDGTPGYDIANTATQLDGTESHWGNYSRMTIADTGKELRFKWEAVSVDNNGAATVKAYFERSYGQKFDTAKVGTAEADVVYVGADRVWRKGVKGNNL